MQINIMDLNNTTLPVVTKDFDSFFLFVYSRSCGVCKNAKRGYLKALGPLAEPDNITFCQYEINNLATRTALREFLGNGKLEYPKIIFFEDGEQVSEIKGFPGSAEYRNFIVQHINAVNTPPQTEPESD